MTDERSADLEPVVADPLSGAGPTTGRSVTRVVVLSPSNVWRVGLTLLAVVAFGLLVRFVITDGGGVLFTVLMSWFAAIAMAPAVTRLSRHMRRGAATGIVMGGFALFVVVFVAAFGSLFVDQMAELIRKVPDILDGALRWANDTFSTSLSRDEILASVDLTPDRIAAAAGSIGISLLGFVGSAFGAVFSVFTFGMFIFYLSANMPQLERWVAGLFPARQQKVVATVWTLTAQKTGGYVGARVILATINAVTTGIVFAVIGMPYWLPLALWTGIVAQFVPTVGTYISIALPVVVGLLSPNPVIGVIALVWAVLYQQVENLTIEPRVSAKAVDVNPAVSFGAVLLGAALFGVAGAFLAVPVVAMLLSLLDVYGHRHEILPDIEDRVARAERPSRGPRPGRRKNEQTSGPGKA
jgi:predicted PurR-regulated permease PerM